MKIAKTKICAKCKIPKSLNEFYKNKSGKFGVIARCKKCELISRKAYRKANKDKLKARRKIYNIKNKEKIKAYNKKYKHKNKEKLSKYDRKWRAENIERTKEYKRNYRIQNIERIKKVDSEWQSKNRKKRNVTQRKYWLKKRTELKFRLNGNVATAINKSLKGNKNGWHWEALTGYTLEMLKKHLEKQFTKDMTWDNYGKDGWWIDHKIPVNVFNFTKTEHRDFKRCWALKNLQPMWASDNMSKQAKLDKHFQPSLLI